MKSKTTIAVVIGILVIGVGYLALGLVFSFPSALNPFYESCLDLSLGMNQEEVNSRMQNFLDDSNYVVQEDGPGKFGWKDRLNYDSSLHITLDKDPWYKLDQHPWR